MDINFYKYRKYKNLYKQKNRNQYGNGIQQNLNNYGNDRKLNKKISNKSNKKLGCNKLVYFFDNDASHFVDSGKCVCVVPIEINQSKTLFNEKGKRVYTTKNEYQNYINKLDNNAKQYAGSIILKKGIDSYDPKSGLNEKQIKEWINKLKQENFRNNTAAFIFDWDRTLTKLKDTS